MIRHSLLLGAAFAATCLPAGVAAQAVVQPLGQTDADLLAAQMRLLAADPRNMVALATAGELSLRLGDLSGAAALFARADKVDPRSGRVKAGMGSILVRSERPGEALRFFGQAERYGWPVARFAADRGLAFDLVGQQDRAQRDYRLALQNGADDETARRYALSLGIAGRQTQALEQLDPLIRRQDRAAWRARAFVMAMNGDTAGAARIATTMMPAGMAQGLGAFFQRLPTLPAVDRAFAVHFGEIAPTPERLADARLTPAYAPLPPEPVATAPVQVAAVVPDRQQDRRARRGDADRGSRRPVAGPAPTTRPAAVAAAIVPAASTSAAAMRESNVRVAASAAPAPQPAIPAARPLTLVAALAPTPPRSPVPVAAVPTDRVPAVTAAATVAPPRPVASTTTGAATASRPIGVVAAAPAAPVPVASAVPATAAPVTAAPASAITQAPVAPVASQAATERADSVLARIVASLSIPASELGVVAPSRPDPAPVAIPAAVERVAPSTTGRRIVAEASAKEGRDAALRRTVAARLTGDAEADEPAWTTRGRRGATPLATVGPVTPRETRARRGTVDQAEIAAAAEPTPSRARRRGAGTAAEDVPLTPAQRRAAARKDAADRKAAAEKKELADRAAAEKKAARSNPARIWVQVAGGANEGDLGKAWSVAQAKAPALKGRAGYKTPLRATNRVLTGPFRTDAEARAFVNRLRREGVSAFSFTSDPGQKVDKLGAARK